MLAPPAGEVVARKIASASQDTWLRKAPPTLSYPKKKHGQSWPCLASWLPPYDLLGSDYTLKRHRNLRQRFASDSGRPEEWIGFNREVC